MGLPFGPSVSFSTKNSIDFWLNELKWRRKDIEYWVLNQYELTGEIVFEIEQAKKKMFEYLREIKHMKCFGIDHELRFRFAKDHTLHKGFYIRFDEFRYEEYMEIAFTNSSLLNDLTFISSKKL